MRGRVASAMAISSWRCSPWLRLATTLIGAVGEADAGERGACGRAQLGLAARVAPEAEGVAGMGLDGESDVVQRREVEEQRGDLERAGEPERAAPPGRQGRDVPAGEDDAAGVRGDLAGELADQRGLAGAVRADDGVQLAGGTSSDDVVGGDDAAEALGQAVDLQQRLRHGAQPRQHAVDAAAREQHDQQQHGAQHQLPVLARRSPSSLPVKGPATEADEPGSASSSSSSARRRSPGPNTRPCRPAPP